MNELKPEDVMRALEQCSREPMVCEGCPMVKQRGCITKLCEITLALLREKDAEIDRLKNQLIEFTQC